MQGTCISTYIVNRETVGSKFGESVFAISLRHLCKFLHVGWRLLNTIILCNSNVWIQRLYHAGYNNPSGRNRDSLYTFWRINYAKFKPNFIDMDIGTANSEHFRWWYHTRTLMREGFLYLHISSLVLSICGCSWMAFDFQLRKRKLLLCHHVWKVHLTCSG